MLHQSLGSDRVELASAIFDLRDHSQVVMLECRAIDHRMHNGEATATGRAHFHQCGILKLSDSIEGEFRFYQTKPPGRRAFPCSSSAAEPAHRRAIAENCGAAWPRALGLHRM